MVTHRYQRTLTQSIHPIFVPQHSQKLGIQARLEDLYIKLIVLVGVDSEIFDFAQWNGLVFRSGDIRWRVVFRIGSKRANIDFASGDRAVGVDLGIEYRYVENGLGNEDTGDHARQQRQMDLGISGCSSVY